MKKVGEVVVETVCFWILLNEKNQNNTTGNSMFFAISKVTCLRTK
jgi:hypothetical protein